jgi:hypothetical protein
MQQVQNPVFLKKKKMAQLPKSWYGGKAVDVLPTELGGAPCALTQTSTEILSQTLNV